MKTVTITATFKSTGVSKSVKANIHHPRIIDGFWSDPQSGGALRELTYGEKAKFTVGCDDVPDGTELSFVLFDFDSRYNADDELERSYTATVKDNMAELEIIPNPKWEESAKYETDQVVEVYFKVTGKVRKIDMEAQLPKKEEEYLKVYSQKETVTVIIELPMKNYDYKNIDVSDKIAAKLGLLGHTAIAIGQDYYDYGPEFDPNILFGKINEQKYGDLNKDGDSKDIFDGVFDKRLKESGLNQQSPSAFGTLGRPWWDKHLVSGKKDIMLNDLKAILNNKKQREAAEILGETHLIEIDVTISQAQKIRNWWKTKYSSNLGMYSVNPIEKGSHCTSTVRDSLIEAKVIRNVGDLSTPKNFLQHISIIRHTAGKDINKINRKKKYADIS